MQTLSPRFNDELRTSVVQLLWRQWSALGVAGPVAQEGNCAVDPEALLLISTQFARHDARLFDEIADWLQRNGHWINLMRLSRLEREFAFGDTAVLGALAEHLAQRTTHAKWKALSKNRPPSQPPALLFTHLPPPNRADEIFLRWGWLRPELEFRGLSKAPHPTTPASFLLKLRALFGLQSRAEVVAWLLAHEAGHPAQIARETGYFRGSIQNVLNELEVSGLIYSAREGREKHFVAPRGNWRFLLASAPKNLADFPKWVPWSDLFALLCRYEGLTASPDFNRYSPDLQAIELERSLSPLIARLCLEGEPFRALAGPMPTAQAFSAKLNAVVASF
ncbi:hypothetical protein [Nibricoccus sp. IMCC34717]|uniref:hypothetical protein n=1 Tax=Nibricoccus sp. IMCC34717 TaxID=3034021 RepID=UPI00384F3048